MIRVGIDIGGTFTDLVAVEDEAGKIFTVKVRSTPRFPEIGFHEALNRFLQNSGYTGEQIGVIIHVGTIGTNLFLGQLGLEKPKVCLLTTRGFKDVIEIGRQNRPRLYDIFFTRPAPLVSRQHRLEVDERTGADGRILTEVREEEMQRIVSKLREINPDSVAICFLNSYANPHNEKIAKSFLVNSLTIPVFTSYEVDPEHREYERFSTTVVNALLAPVVSRYINSAKKGLETLSIDAPLYIMSSAGGIVDSEEVVARPIVSVESGPAAGVVGASKLSSILGLDRVISLDMGGTTAKAGAVINGKPLVASEMVVGGEVHMGRVIGGTGYPVRVSTIDLAEVSAGGGTIAWVDAAGVLRVGPMSAGADPGPACYGRGGDKPTVTDANLLLGRLGALLGGEMEVYPDMAMQAVKQLADSAGLEVEDACWTILTLANLKMAKAVNLVTLERGLDPRDFTLMAFGGAGPMHAAELAEYLGIDTIVIPPHPGLFSALGLLTTDMRYDFVRGYVSVLDDVTAEKIEEMFRELEDAAVEKLASRGLDPGRGRYTRSVDMRYFGQGYELEITVGRPFNLHEAINYFTERHRAVYGYTHEGSKVEVTALRLSANYPVEKLKLEDLDDSEDIRRDAARTVYFKDGWVETEIMDKKSVKSEMKGPLIIEEKDTTVVVPPGWNVKKVNASSLLLRRSA